MSQLRRTIALVAAGAVSALVACAMVLGAAPQSASAASPVVLVSTDGVTYLPGLSVGLFDSAGLLVPGGSATSALWIKNPTTAPATVRVNVGDVTSSSADLGRNMLLTAVNTADGSTISATWNQLTQCDIMVQPTTIAGGAVIRITLTLAMLNAPGLVAQHQNASLTATVSMRDAVAGTFPISTCDPGTIAPAQTEPAQTEPAATQPGRVLGYTGDTFPTQLLLLGSVLVGVGWFLVVARRRHRREAKR